MKILRLSQKRLVALSTLITAQLNCDMLSHVNDTRIESRWGRNLPRPSSPALESTQLPVQCGWVSFPESKAAVA